MFELFPEVEHNEEDTVTIINAIESILILAHVIAAEVRLNRPYTGNAKGSVCFHCAVMDKYEIPGAIQNSALMFVNDGAEDDCWNVFYKRNKRTVATEVFNGKTYEDIVREVNA